MSEHWTDGFVADSDLPSDDFTWTEGSNYGLDGFHHDQTLGEGVANRPSLPGSIFAGTLPDHLFQSDAPPTDEGFSLVDDTLNLTGMLSEGAVPQTQVQRQAASLADLAWLDPTQPQDPDRLPKELKQGQPPLNSIPELEEAWGVNRRTDGLSLVPNKDKAIADYEKSIESGIPALPGAGKNAADVSWHIKKAIRRSTYGHDLRAIQAELFQALGNTPVAQEAFRRVAQDHGLNGNVFVRASAFSGLKNGKWLAELKKVARTARYVITKDATIAQKLSMTMVAQVPWTKALRHYAPRLAASGYKMAAVGSSPRRTLQYAFLVGPESVEHVADFKPSQVAPADTVTTAQARKAFKEAPRQAREVVVTNESRRARKAALVQVAKAVAAGWISKEDGLRLGQSKEAPHVILKRAESVARANLLGRKGTYKGEGAGKQAHRPQERSGATQGDLEKAAYLKAKVRLAKMVQVGQLTRKEAKVALKQKTAAGVLEVAAAIVLEAGHRRKPVMKAAKVQDYAGAQFTTAQQQKRQGPKRTAARQAMHLAAKASGIRVAEFQTMATWFRQQMSEGFAGKDLTDLMSVRFASPLRAAAVDILTTLRSEHEGLSGHLYVDAAAYASPKGAKGCEAAALKHRTNQIKYVKAMDRCEGCVFANANGQCMKYGKALLWAMPPGTMEYQAKMLSAADAPDHEITAALFNPSEFGLQDGLNHIAFQDETPSNEELGEVLFGGLFF